eukprot:jgi/Astpho2/6193/Aster-x1353
MLRQAACRLVRSQQQTTCLLGCRAFADAAVAKGEIGLICGAPEGILRRQVVIYAPSRTASQQGSSRTAGPLGKGPGWKIAFQNMQKWENPLIGWTSTADPVDTVARSGLEFGSREAAIAFADKHGWEYEVREPTMKRTDRTKRFAGYGDNYSVKRAGYPIGGLPSEQAGAGKPSGKQTKGSTK